MGTCCFYLILAAWEEGFDKSVSFLLPQCFHCQSSPHARARPTSDFSSRRTHKFPRRLDTVSFWFKAITPRRWRSVSRGLRWGHSRQWMFRVRDRTVAVLSAGSQETEVPVCSLIVCVPVWTWVCMCVYVCVKCGPSGVWASEQGASRLPSLGAEWLPGLLAEAPCACLLKVSGTLSLGRLILTPIQFFGLKHIHFLASCINWGVGSCKRQETNPNRFEPGFGAKIEAKSLNRSPPIFESPCYVLCFYKRPTSPIFIPVLLTGKKKI